HLRELLKISEDYAVNLWAIPDRSDGKKPTLPAITLIKLAIYGSEAKMLTFRGICSAFISRFHWYRENSQVKAWKNTVSHALTTYPVFVRLGRVVGAFWIVDLNQEENEEVQPSLRKRSRTKGHEKVRNPVRKRVQPKGQSE
ncbi:hypothetical protein C8R43DRAFT_910019, partial [Mycena crocata]